MSRPNPAADQLSFRCGAVMRNRFMLAPMTNCQSHADGRLSDDEFHWLTMRARGGFGLTMTCAAHVQAVGQGFPGQLGIFADAHGAGHERLAAGIRAEGSLAVVQLHHAGMRSPETLIGQRPVCPSDNAKTGARALELYEVEQLRDDFISAAERSQSAGYDGVEIHGAHGYVLCQFLSPAINRRTDRYGGSLENRSRLLVEVIEGVREACGEGFLLGVRLSPERFGMVLDECLWLSQWLFESKLIDFLDISLWDSFKVANEEGRQQQTLLRYFADLPRHGALLTVAGKIMTAAEVAAVHEAGVDFVTIGRAAILHHDFPQRVLADPGFEPVALPVSRAWLAKEGLGEAFIEYMRRWEGFVQEPEGGD
jgi:2,4-dienoyl-CoA reductase-like NADH-dependent reductase (Old Yellow Enzyme family)